MNSEEACFDLEASSFAKSWKQRFKRDNPEYQPARNGRVSANEGSRKQLREKRQTQNRAGAVLNPQNENAPDFTSTVQKKAANKAKQRRSWFEIASDRCLAVLTDASVSPEAASNSWSMLHKAATQWPEPNPKQYWIRVFLGPRLYAHHHQLPTRFNSHEQPRAIPQYLNGLESILVAVQLYVSSITALSVKVDPSVRLSSEEVVKTELWARMHQLFFMLRRQEGSASEWVVLNEQHSDHLWHALGGCSELSCFWFRVLADAMLLDNASALQVFNRLLAHASPRGLKQQAWHCFEALFTHVHHRSAVISIHTWTQWWGVASPKDVADWQSQDPYDPETSIGREFHPTTGLSLQRVERPELLTGLAFLLAVCKHGREAAVAARATSMLVNVLQRTRETALSTVVMMMFNLLGPDPKRSCQ